MANIRNDIRRRTKKQHDIRHKIDGLITRLFCAECLPFFFRAANYGCYCEGRVFVSISMTAVFILSSFAFIVRCKLGRILRPAGTHTVYSSSFAPALNAKYSQNTFALLLQNILASFLF